MKALEKDRTRRYESASALAADVERYLADEPVEACPPSAAYRLRKFARRHKGALVTAAVVVMRSWQGTGVSVWQAVEAARPARLPTSNADLAKKNEEIANGRQAEAEMRRKEADRERQRANANLQKAVRVVDGDPGDPRGHEDGVPAVERFRRQLLNDAVTSTTVG